MMQLLIEGLKSEYAVLKAAIDNTTTCDKDTCMNVLNSVFRKVVLSSTSYIGLQNAREIIINCEMDMAFVRGELTQKEENERKEWHYSRITEQLGAEGKTIDEY